MKIGEMGEFGLIEAVACVIPQKDPRLVIGIGDDAAVWRCTARHQIATTDTMVEGVHFRLDTVTWYELGWKSLAVNISDIAAMGGLPRYALVTLGLSGSEELESILELYRGMLDVAGRFETVIAGGDMVSSPQAVMVSITVFGEGGDALLTRTAARPGDAIAVTGFTGTSGAGMRMLSTGMKLEAKAAQLLRRAHQEPVPRVPEGQALVSSGVRSAMDVSDGLVGDLAKLCRASGVGARLYLDRVPVHPLVREYFPNDWAELALHGGEDYELLFTAPLPIIERAQAELAARGCVPATVIGEVVEGPKGQVAVIGPDGQETSIGAGGWDHFAATGG